MRRRGWEKLPPMHTHIHTSLHLYIQMCIQMCIQNMDTRPLWLGKTQATLDTNTQRGTQIWKRREQCPLLRSLRFIFEAVECINAMSSSHTHPHTHALDISFHIPSTCTRTHIYTRAVPPLWGPTDSLQSALESRGSSLPLEPVSDTFDTDSDSRSAPFCLGGPNT